MTTVGTDTVQTPRVDAVPKVTGRAVYTEDLPLPPGTLYGAILRSPYAHARLVSMDARRAERLPGIHSAPDLQYSPHYFWNTAHRLSQSVAWGDLLFNLLTLSIAS